MGSLARSFTAAIVCTAGVLLAGTNANSAPAAPKATTQTVVMEGTGFQPETLTVRRGDTVVWQNKDPFPHTATAAGVFDSHNIPANGSWKYTARKPGRYSYICALHPNMKGTLIVE